MGWSSVSCLVLLMSCMDAASAQASAHCNLCAVQKWAMSQISRGGKYQTTSRSLHKNDD